ncbi:MAG TPA: S41 family peptidase [Candidatus Paceibacterota bacterium]|nr:S41 family peptidase [Candidatus Paceibacterota bacterium]HRZ34568.1 S41 family peptidase [Candidatus Paceibacterota bacterium]
MNRLFKKFLVCGAVGAVAVIIFSSGFWSGRGVGFSDVKDYFDGKVLASEEIDLDDFWEVWELIDQKFISASSTEEVSSSDRVLGAIKGMVNSLNDPYTEFLLPEENEKFETTIQGEFSGIGMEVGIRDDLVTVISPLKNSPAERAGIKSGDIVAGIDGISTASMSLDEAVDKIRGPEGTKVKLTLIREGETEALEIEVTRAIINIPTLETEIRDDVFIIYLYNFSANVTSEFRSALREFVSAKTNKLILDLRGNPGGFLSAAVDLASWFLPSGKIVVREQFKNGDDEKIFRSKGYNIFNDNLKMIILIDGGSASASEILAGALKEHKVATVLGTNTFGKGSVQELIKITKDTSLKVTTAQWLTPDGKSISDGGLEPEIIVDSAPEGVELADYQLEEALKLLNK